MRCKKNWTILIRPQLPWLFSIKNFGNKSARWHLKLEDYDYEIFYNPRKITQQNTSLYSPKQKPWTIITKSVLTTKIQTKSTTQMRLTYYTCKIRNPNLSWINQRISLINYKKVKLSKCDILDEINKNVVILPQSETLRDFHQGFENTFEDLSTLQQY